MDELKRLLNIKDADGKFVLDADEVARITGKNRNAVYMSRKGDCKLDKLAIFEKVKGFVDEGDAGALRVTGSKDDVVKAIDVLAGGEKYTMTIRKV